MTTLERILNALKESGCFVGDADEAIAEVQAMQERIKELEAENEDLLQQVNDYEQFSEIISEPKDNQ